MSGNRKKPTSVHNTANPNARSGGLGLPDNRMLDNLSEGRTSMNMKRYDEPRGMLPDRGLDPERKERERRMK